MMRMTPDRAICAICIVLAGISTFAQTKWQLPVTIEALNDVPARVNDQPFELRGVLYIGKGQPFKIRKGQRFLMVRVDQEGGCRIEFEKKQYDVSSCPWLDGFRDHQADVFKVVTSGSVAMSEPSGVTRMHESSR